MAQSTTTVLAPNPTPPTNFGLGVANAAVTPPSIFPFNIDPTTGLPRTSLATSHPPDLTFVDAVYGTITGGGDPFHPGQSPNTVPPYLNDGAGKVGTPQEMITPCNDPTVAVNSALFKAPNSGVAHEGAGTEVSVTAPGSRSECPTIAVSCGPTLTPGTMPTPNGSHASSLSPATNPALTSINPTTTVSGGGTVSLTCTGTNFTPQSVIYVNGVAQVTTFVNSTSLTATVTKKSSAGTWPVTVVTGGTVTTTAQTWTFT